MIRTHIKGLLGFSLSSELARQIEKLLGSNRDLTTAQGQLLLSLVTALREELDRPIVTTDLYSFIPDLIDPIVQHLGNWTSVCPAKIGDLMAESERAIGEAESTQTHVLVADDFVTKPVIGPEIIARLTNLMERQQVQLLKSAQWQRIDAERGKLANKGKIQAALMAINAAVSADNMLQAGQSRPILEQIEILCQLLLDRE